MKLVLVLVAAVAAASIAATLAIGGRLREDTVVPDPYEAGVRWDRDHPRAGADAARPGAAASAVARPAAARCNLADGPCHRAADDLAIALDVSPRPLRTLSRLALAADVSAGGAPVADATVEVAFAMPGMTMGQNRSPLHMPVSTSRLSSSISARAFMFAISPRYSHSHAPAPIPTPRISRPAER